MTQEVIVRFAPSPTGYLHIGGARTAIFNWLFAKKTGGKFILRVEDTDQERSSEALVEGILESLRWLGVVWDDGPYFQSQFVAQHVEAARKLVSTGHAYKCFCTKDELDKKRQDALDNKSSLLLEDPCRRLSPNEASEKEAANIPFTIRFKVPRVAGSVVFTDLVYGTIEKRYEDIEDFVLVRSNGQPLYVLSNAVDDIRDRITHIIRGQDGLANTPKQILIYRALGMPLPVYAHTPLTLDSKKAKISKRTHGELVTVLFYKDHGFLPWALVNYLTLLGWSTSESREFFSRDELIEAFSLEAVSRANSIFDLRKDDPKFFTDPKAISVNAHYIRTLPVEELLPYVKAELEKEGLWDPEFIAAKRQWFLDTIEMIRKRFHFTTDFRTLGRAYFSDEFPIDADALKKNILKYSELKGYFPIIADRLSGVPIFDTQSAEDAVRLVAEELGVKAGILINAIRTAVTGYAVGPGLFEALLAIGQNRVVARLRNAASLLDETLDC